jgi:hypothetical protein
MTWTDDPGPAPAAPHRRRRRLELELLRATHAAAVAAVVDRDERVVLRQRFVRGEELQVGAGRPAVQQQQRRRRRVGVLVVTVEDLTATLQHHGVARWQPRQVQRRTRLGGSGHAAKLPAGSSGDAGELLHPHTQFGGVMQQVERLERRRRRQRARRRAPGLAHQAQRRAAHTAAARSPVCPAAPAMSVMRSPCGPAPRASTRTAPRLPEACGGVSMGRRAVKRSRRVADIRAVMRPACGNARCNSSGSPIAAR